MKARQHLRNGVEKVPDHAGKARGEGSQNRMVDSTRVGLSDLARAPDNSCIRMFITLFAVGMLTASAQAQVESDSVIATTTNLSRGASC